MPFWPLQMYAVFFRVIIKPFPSVLSPTLYDFHVILRVTFKPFFGCGRHDSLSFASFFKVFSHYSKVSFGFLYYGLFDFYFYYGY